MTDGTIWLREYKTMAEVCDAWAKDRQRIEELETVRDDMRLLARDRGEKLAEHWKRIKKLEAENILLKKQVERIINEVDRLSGITHEHSVWFAHGMKLVLKHIRAAIAGEQE